MNKKTVKKIMKNPYALFPHIAHHCGYLKWMDDETYTKLMYRGATGKKLNLENPKLFNEKIQWLKLNNHNPDYVQMVDKHLAKKYVADKIGAEHVIPEYGVWDSFDDIDFSKLPDRFVLKCNHDCGGYVIVEDKNAMDIPAAKAKLEKCLSRNYYWVNREWLYKDIKPKILAEKLMRDDETENNLTDYKFFCFDGVPRYVYTVRDRQSNGSSLHRFYNTDWELQDLDLDHRGEKKVAEKRPECLDEMLRIASVLSEGIKHVRVDLYLINGEIYFGELTFTHFSGCEHWDPEKWNEILGELLDI